MVRMISAFNVLLCKEAIAFTTNGLKFRPCTYRYQYRYQYNYQEYRSFQCSTRTCLQLQLSPDEIAASLGPDRTIASEPFTWEQLKEIVNFGDPTMHSRSMEVQEKYLLHSRQIKKEWRSINDFILHSKFEFDKKVEDVGDGDGTGKFIASPSLDQAKRENRIEKRLLLNEYPYYVCPGIEHWCLWKLGGRVESDEIEWAERELITMGIGADKEDIMSWVNPPHLQSIPDIDHAHFLCLRSIDR